MYCRLMSASACCHFRPFLILHSNEVQTVVQMCDYHLKTLDLFLLFLQFLPSGEWVGCDC